MRKKGVGIPVAKKDRLRKGEEAGLEERRAGAPGPHSARLRGLLQYVASGSAEGRDALAEAIERAVDEANEDEEPRERHMGFMTAEHNWENRLYIAQREGRAEGIAIGERSLADAMRELGYKEDDIEAVLLKGAAKA